MSDTDAAGPQRSPWWRLAALLLIVAGVTAVIWWLTFRERPVPDSGVTIVSETSETTLHPLPVNPPQQPRWRDMADEPYSARFREEFDYFDTDAHPVEVSYAAQYRTLAGTIIARRLKPWFAYQVKLVGAVPIRGVAEKHNAGDVEAWSSWQLGRLGRWWCDDCHWNVPDAELARHVSEGHSVRGYLLFDWLVTDESGHAVHDFALEGSLHVLWRVGQREQGPRDRPSLFYALDRTAYGYGDGPPAPAGQTGIFGEWEPDRPEVGALRLPPGEYAVRLNLTEESFHANFDEERMLVYGGFWAWVLEADLRFEVRPPVSRASRPGSIPGPHQGLTALWRRLRGPANDA